MAPLNTTDPPPIQLRFQSGVEAKFREQAGKAGLPLEAYLVKLAEREVAVAPPTRLAQELDWLGSRTPADIEETRRRLFSHSPQPRPIPDGKTLSDMVEGKWPGDETDEEVHAALERLS